MQERLEKAPNERRKGIIWPTIKKKKLIRATLLASKLQIHERNIENE